MAQLTVHANGRSIAALASLFVFIGVTTYAVASGASMGLWIYIAAFALMFLGFWSKEDHLAVGGIMAVSLALVLDIMLRIGVLGFTECHATFSALTGC